MLVPATRGPSYLNGDRSGPLLHEHWTCTPIEDGQRKRAISNGLNYITPQGQWQASAPAAVDALDEPPDWSGLYDFSLASLASPLQSFAGVEQMVGMRRSDLPGSWLNLKAVGGASVEPVTSEDGSTVTYPGLWPGCDLIYAVGDTTLGKIVRVWDKAIAPDYFEWTAKAAPGHTVDITANTLAVLDSGGQTVLNSSAVWGQDSATLAPTPDGRNVIACTLTEQDPVGGLQVVRLTPNPDDMVSAVGTVDLDPNVVISGPVDTEDTYLDINVPTLNFGLRTIVFVGSSTVERHGMFRIKNSAIPDGTYTGFNINYPVGSILQVISGSSTLAYYKVLAANAAWLQGTGVGGTPNVGATWDEADASVSLAWAGGANGCFVSGVDREAVAGAGQLFTLISIPYTVALPTSWLDFWLANGETGYVLSEDVGSSRVAFNASNRAAATIYNYDITFTPPAATVPFVFDLVRRKRR